MKLTRRDLLAGAAALSATSVLPFAIGGAGAAAKSLLKIIPHADLKVIDPIWTTGYISRNHGYMVYDTLFAMDDNLKPQPQMVSTYEKSADGLTWQFKLRDGLSWHDGGPVTAEDCVQSLKRWALRDGMGQRLFAVVDKIGAPDARTIEMVLKAPYGLVLESIGKISSNVAFMMPKRVAETPGDQQIKEAIGSGPFVFKNAEWVPGSKAVYEKFAGYVPRPEPVSAAAGGKIARAERVEWLTIGDPTTAMNALISGEVDYWEQVPPDLVPVVSQAPGVKTEVLDNLGSMALARFNHLIAPTDNLLVRQAICKAFDQQDFLTAAIGNPEYFKVNPSVYPPASPMHTDEGAGLIAPSIEEAKALLAKSGYKGEKLVLMQATDISTLSALALVAAEKLRKIGINVDLQAMDWSTVISRRASKSPADQGGWNIFITWWIGGDSVHPLAGIQFGGNGEKGWFGWAKDEQVEASRDAFAKATDPAEQKKIAGDVQRRLYEIAAFANLGTFFVPCGYRETVTGMIKSPVQFFWNMEAKTS